MELSIFLLLYLISVPLFFLIDLLWLGYIARNLYQRELAQFLGEVRWGVAIGFYLIYLLGVTYFASYPAFLDGDVEKAILVGGLFGFFTYMTYDMTNLATLKNWPIKVVVVDVVWGSILAASVAGGTVYIAGLFF